MTEGSLSFFGGPDGLLSLIFLVCLLHLIYERFAIMSNSYSLDDLRADLDSVYAPVIVDGVTLRSLMRLNKDEREQVLVSFQKTQTSDTSTPEGMNSMIEGITEIIAVVGGKGGPGLVKKIGDDVALAVKIMELWTEATNPGEASNSPV